MVRMGRQQGKLACVVAVLDELFLKYAGAPLKLTPQFLDALQRAIASQDVTIIRCVGQ